MIPMNYLSLIQIAGNDSATFLQGQLTCDVLAIQPDSASFMACCDRKGRVLANGLIYFTPPHYYLLVPSSISKLLLTHFKKYALFSKVSLTETKDSTIIEKAFQAINPTLATALSSQNAFNDACINLGLAFIEPKTSGLFTPQMLDWQKHGGVSFTKGCFLGQEVVARTEHLGQLKRHLHRITLNCTETHAPGDAFQNSQQETLGIICSPKGSENKFLAVLQDKALAIQETLVCAHQKPIYL